MLTLFNIGVYLASVVLKSTLYWKYLAVLWAIMPFAMKFLVPSIEISYTCCSGSGVMLDIFSNSISEPKDLYICTVSTEYTEFNKLGGVKMPNITLSISEELKKELDSMPEINWSEVTREFLSNKVKRLELLKKLEKQLESKEEQELTKWSVELGRRAKKGSFKRLLSELPPKRREELLSKLSSEKRREVLE